MDYGVGRGLGSRSYARVTALAKLRSRNYAREITLAKLRFAELALYDVALSFGVMTLAIAAWLLLGV